MDGGDIGDGEVVVGTDQVRRGFEQKTDTKFGLVSGRDGEERVTRLEVKSVGEGAGEGDGIGFGDESDGIGGGAERVLEAVGHELAIGEGINPNKVKEFTRVAGKRGNELDGRGNLADGWVMAQERDYFFGKAKSLAFDGEVGSAGNEVERGAKGAKSGFIHRLDGDNGGNADGEGEEVEEGESFVAEKISGSVRKENA